ncbi:S-layer homology domain-containing protein [Tissierella sp.]|uniref:S-layer homology domain-containing protein n=1 Tax=Tissierella sp. TaxID=41274 RepID=UPI00285D80B0|nr:S-layer homology domain-containing protein [Tissierella sp.]MDR7857560.1 S-layer homology domain-containing protein [Tissierella sp.]
MATKDWIVEKGYFGVGGLNLDKKIKRSELATLAIRMVGLEAKAKEYTGKSSFKDVNDWSTPYVEMAKKQGLISGKSKDLFHPNGNLTYVELLAVFMRALGYKDGIDFVKYPDDYYKKALEIGLADMYISQDEEVLREIVLSTMVKALNTNIKGQDYTLYKSLNNTELEEVIEEATKYISMTNVKFNTTISGVFSGILKGSDDFTGYKVVLLSENGTFYGDSILGKSGSFSIDKFDISVVAKLSGYRYEVYNNKGNLILKSKLQ